MNPRTTIALLIILALVTGIGYVYTQSRANKVPAQVSTRPDFFYLVDDDDIGDVEVTYRGTTMKFTQTRDFQWFFDTVERPPVDKERWGGITLLLSGPQYKRIIAQTSANLPRYGLESPTILIKVYLKNRDQEVKIQLGDKTPDGVSHYALYQDGKAIYLVDSSWGDVIARLVTEPPYQPPPVPGATPTTSVPAVA